MSLGDKTKRGVFWVMMGNFADEAVLFVSSVILARLLEPNDFGIAGVAVLITNYIKRMRAFGFGLAIVQKKNITEDHMNAVFMANFALGVLLWAIIFFSSGYIAEFFNSPLSGDVAIVTSLTFLLNPFSSVQTSYLNRHMKFKKLSSVTVMSDAVMSAGQISMAFMGFGVWSLAWPRLLEPLYNAIVLSRHTGYWPKFKYNKEAMREIFSFGFWVFLRSQIAYLSHNMDFLIVGKFLGTQQLGFYERAFNVMDRPQKRISGKTSSVLLSAFARMQEEPDRVRRAFRKVILTMTTVGMPIQIGMLAVADSFVYVVFGAKWMPIVFPLKILNIAGLLHSIETNIQPIITALGRVKENAYRSAISLSFFTLFAFLGVRYGLTGVSVAVVLYRVVDIIIIFILIRSITIIRLNDMLAATMPSLVCSMLMLFIVELYQIFIRNYVVSVGPFMFFSSVFVGAVSYIGFMFLLRFKEFVEVRDDLLQDIKPVVMKVRNKLFARKETAK